VISILIFAVSGRVSLSTALVFFSLAVVIVSACVCFRDLRVPVTVVPNIITE